MPLPRPLLLAFSLLAALGPGPCVAPLDLDPPCADPEDCRLHEAGRLARVRIGFHDENGAGGADGALAAREGNAFTNHGLSWAALQPTPDAVTGSMDAACDFSSEHDLFQVGFHFAWHQLFLDDLADWVLEIQDAEALRTVLRERVRILFARCPALDRIDVLNEPFFPLVGDTIHENHFHAVLGPDYIAELFRIVREEAPPGVELFLNENFVEYVPARAAAYVALVRDLLESGAPVDAVGLQTHLLRGEPDWALYRGTMEQLAALGVRVFVSELDVPVAPSEPDRLALQAERYRRVVETCLAVPACDTIIVWGITDAHTWLDSFTVLTGPDADPLLFDDALQPKPAYFAFREALLRGRGGDHPIGFERLLLTDRPSRGSALWLRSEDAGVVTPSPGSRNDPRRADSAGATIELIEAAGTVHEIVLAAGSGWSAREGQTIWWGGMRDWRRGPTWLRLREGEGLELMLSDVPLEPVRATDGVSIRITLGTLRLCAELAPEAMARRTDRMLEARGVAKPPGWSCGAASAP